MPSDAVLVRRARRGDRAAFAELVERHYATLVACCRRMVGDSAHDAAQDAVVTALLSLDRLRDAEKFGAWLVGIGLNACRAQLRGPGPLTRRIRPKWSPSASSASVCGRRSPGCRRVSARR